MVDNIIDTFLSQFFETTPNFLGVCVFERFNINIDGGDSRLQFEIEDGGFIELEIRIWG